MRAADRAFAAEDWETAISRAYYALYHGVIAVTETKTGVSYNRWDHVQLQNDFRIHFSNRGFLFSAADARDFARLFEARLVADYGRETLRRPEVRTLMMKARSLHEKIGEVVRDA